MEKSRIINGVQSYKFYVDDIDPDKGEFHNFVHEWDYQNALDDTARAIAHIASLEAQLEKAEKVIEKTMNFPMLQGESGHLLREYFAEKEKNGK